MSFKNVKKAVYNTVTDSLSAVSTGVSVVDKGLKYADNYMIDALAIQEAGRASKIENALKIQEEELLQERRDLYVDSAVAKAKFIESLTSNEEKLNVLKDKLSAETLEKYGDLL